jgi:hypothetical protein
MMRREEAIIAATAALWGGHRDIENAQTEGIAFVRVPEALGLIKFKKPADIAETILSAMILFATSDSAPGSGWMVGPYGAHKIVERLRGAGFEIVATP